MQNEAFVRVSGNRDYSDTLSADNNDDVVLLIPLGPDGKCDDLNQSPLNI